MMKRILILMGMMLMVSFSISMYSQEVLLPAGELSQIAIDLSTFTGIVAFVSLAVTQLAKFVPVINSRVIWKILTSVAAGCVSTLISWRMDLAAFLADLAWWQMVIQGVLAGLTACGAYDLIKSAISNKQV